MILDILISVYKKYGYLFQGRLFWSVILFYKEMRVRKQVLPTLKYIWEKWNTIKVYKGKKTNSIEKLLQNVEFDSERCELFIYSIDVFKTCQLKGRVLGNCTIDYKKIIEHGLNDFYMDDEDDYSRRNNQILNAINSYIDRLKIYVLNSSIANKNEIAFCLTNMKNAKASSLHDALQRILIINQLQWQTGHILVGLGRLDYCLDGFLEKDNKAREYIDEFLELINKYHTFKSNALMGDTGQVIILGGSDENGTAFYNIYSQIIMETIIQKRLSDPKILFRVCKNTNEDVWIRLIDNMASSGPGILMSNDDTIIPKLVAFGYEPEDAYNYTTSACWEPIVGMSYEQNNILSLNFLEPFEMINEPKVEGFDELLDEYQKAMNVCISDVLKYLDKLKWDEDPIYSLFDDVSRKKHTDVGDGGSKYFNYGIMTVGLSNTVNSLLNIKRYVFEKHTYSYKQFIDSIKNNFSNNMELCEQLKSLENGFGSDEPEVVELTNYLINCVRHGIKQYRNKYGYGIKFGLSSPHYIMDSKRFPASLDGRKKGEPFGIHISNDSSSYVEVINLASQLNYESECINGNVVDLVIPATQIKDNKSEFESLIKIAFRKGVQQIQIHTLDSKMLIDAKKNPDKYPDLIVRVWGFNAYFNELPEEYKDFMIERALKSEGTVSQCAAI